MKSAAEVGSDEPTHTFTRSTIAICSVVLTLVLVSLPASARGEAAAGLVAAYAFDEGGGASVSDGSGSGNVGTVVGASWDPAGKFGKALSFDGAGDVVSIPDAASLHLSSAMTLEAWVKPAALGSTWRTVIFKERAGGMTYALYANDDFSRPLGQLFDTAEREAGGTTQLTPNVWTHLAATYDGSSLKLFVNAAQVSSVSLSSSIVSSTGALKIGGNAIWGEYFTGLIDEVRIYNRPLTATEISTDMNTAIDGDTTAPTAPSGLAVTGQTQTSITISWTAATDNVGVTGYGLYRDLTPAGTTTTATTATITGLTCGTSYQLAVDAQDAAGNRSTKTTLTTTTAACNPTAAGLVAAYAFDEGGGASVSDGSGSGNVGTVVGASWDPAGKFGKALSFDGAGDVVSIPDAASLHLSSAMTLEAWVKPAALGSTWRTVIFKERAGGMTYALYANDDFSRPLGQLFDTAEREAGGTTQLTPNVWTHLAATYDGSSLKLFVNAAQVSSVSLSSSIVSSTGALKIGGNAIWGEYFTGLIDEVRIYNRPLTATEISTDMNTAIDGDTTAPTAPSGLAVTGQTQTSITISWTAATDNVGVTGYGLYRDLTPAGTTTTATTATITGLTCGTSYQLAVDAQDAAGNRSTKTTLTTTTAACNNDTVAPTVTITAPVSGASVSGTVTVTAAAADNQAVAGVQFRVDGSVVGAEDVSAPYSVGWSTLAVADGSHTLTAVARDTSGNTATSGIVLVSVSNSLNTGDALTRVTVGSGYTHAATRELVRTPSGVVYIFVADDTAQKRGSGPGLLHAWKGNRAGIPTAFAEVDAAHRPTGAAGTTDVVGSPDARLDRAGIVHLLYTREDDETVVYQTFSTLTDTWGPVTVVATAAPVPYTSSFHKRDTHNAIILDANDIPHLVYLKGNSLLYENRIGGSWSTPVTLDSAATPKHPMVAFDSAGNLHVSWMTDGSAPTVKYTRRSTNGTWGQTETVANNDVLYNGTEDQGPSLVVTASGVPYILYLNTADLVRIRYRSATSWLADDPPAAVYTHAPQIYAQGDDIYVFLGHDRDIDYAYLYQLGGAAGTPWSDTIKLATGQTVDGSASVRWDPFRETNANVIDTAFFDEDIDDSGGFVGELYYMAVLPARVAGPPPPPPPPTETGGLVAAYGFNEGSGVSVTDLSGSGNSGTATGTGWSPSGKYGKALSFDGTSSIVTIPDSNSLDLSSGMTIEAWVNPTAVGADAWSWRTVVLKEQPAGMAYALYANNGSARPAGQVNIGGEQNALGVAQVPVGTWTHLAVTYDGDSLELYVNGLQVGSKTQSGFILASDGPLRIGGNAVWGEYFAGLIDEVRVYNRALSRDEITADMGAAL